MEGAKFWSQSLHPQKWGRGAVLHTSHPLKKGICDDINYFICLGQ
jgi:hypothetical protein